MKQLFTFLIISGLVIMVTSACKKSTVLPEVLPASAAAVSVDTSALLAVTGPVVRVGDGHSALIIDGNETTYAAGTTIIVKAGTYPNGITIQNLTGVTVRGRGVILDGLNQAKEGYYNCLNLNNLNQVTVYGFTTRNNGYRMLNINSRMLNLTIDHCTFSNCAQGIFAGAPSVVWNGTDNTVQLLNFSITNNTFTNCGSNWLGGNVGGGQVINLAKNLVISGNTVNGGNPGALFFCGAVDGFQIFNNNIQNVNLNITNDNRIIMMAGNGDAYNNTISNIQGHSIGIWSVSFGSIAKTSRIYNNTCIGSLKYSSFEFQEFADFNIPGVTTKADLIVDGNICGNLNTEHHTEFGAAFIDNYEYGVMGGKVTLSNNKGYNFFPQPADGTVWNMAKPDVLINNTYSISK